MNENHSDILVVKVGGSEGIDLDAICDDLATIHPQRPVVLVHGGSHRTNQVAEALGHQPRFITSPSGYTSRHTDRKTMGIFQMVYCGEVNKGIVERLQARGVNALGISGMDGKLWQGKRKAAIYSVEDGRKRVIRDSYTGKVEQVNVALLRSLMDQSYLPVLTPPAISFQGESINVDGDRAAAKTAAALQARQLLILSNVPGLLKEFPDESSLLEECSFNEIDSIAETFAQGRMRIKLLGAKEAIAEGVGQVVLGDARGRSPIQQAIAGKGTVIRHDEIVNSN